MAFDTIEFNGKEYPVRDVYVNKEVGTVNVSNESLAAALNPNDNWDDVTPEAEYIDNKVYFYAPDDVVIGSIKKLTQYVKNNS